MANTAFRVGDRVKWESRSGTAEGQIVSVATESGCIGDLVYDASKDYPRYIVETGEGKRDAHRPVALSPS